MTFPAAAAPGRVLVRVVLVPGPCGAPSGQDHHCPVRIRLAPDHDLIAGPGGEPDAIGAPVARVQMRRVGRRSVRLLLEGHDRAGKVGLAVRQSEKEHPAAAVGVHVAVGVDLTGCLPAAQQRWVEPQRVDASGGAHGLLQFAAAAKGRRGRERREGAGRWRSGGGDRVELASVVSDVDHASVNRGLQPSEVLRARACPEWGVSGGSERGARRAHRAVCCE